MKSKLSLAIIASLMFFAVSKPPKLHGQERTQHHRYTLVDVGTFGGPVSYVNFNTDVLNNHGTVVGSSETSIPQPPNTNGFPCPPANIFKAFEWENGVVTNLDALAGGNCSNAIWINANGEIAGNSENGAFDPLTALNQIRAVVWSSGKVFDLGTLGGNQSGAQAINDRGQVTGFALNDIPDAYSLFDLPFLGSSNGTETRAFVWRDGRMHDLGTLGGPDAFGWFINDRGQVAGYSYTNSSANEVTGQPTLHPFLWDEGRMKDLGTLGGFGSILSTTLAPVSVGGLNNRGQVIGLSPLDGDQVSDPFVWDGTKLVDMFTQGIGGQFLSANVINDAGEIAGAAAFPTRPFDAALWKDGVVTDLGALDGDCFSEAWSINSRGQIGGVSVSCDGNTWRAFLWENGVIVDLNALVPSGPALQLIYAIGINDRGEIAGTGVLPGVSTAPPDQDTMSHVFVLIPCDENHPGIEGCDYSLVDPANISTVHPALTNEAPTWRASHVKFSPAEMMARYHSSLATRHSRFLAPPPK
jgi:probable HAF family extracellular repeat protein